MILLIKLKIYLGKIIDKRKAAFPGEVISDFLQENKNYFPKLEEFANMFLKKFKKIIEQDTCLYVNI